MALVWTLANSDAAIHVAKKIAAAQARGDKAEEKSAWDEYNALHRVAFVLVQFDINGTVIGEPKLVVQEADAETHLNAVGQGNPPAETASLYAYEQMDVPICSWKWATDTGSWSRM